MNDNNSELETHRIDRQRAAMGGRVEVRDSRMSALVGIGLTITPVAVVAIGAWIANSIADLDKTVARLVTQNESVMERLNKNDVKDDQQDAHINSVDMRVSTLEGRTFRGVAGYGESKSGH